MFLKFKVENEYIRIIGDDICCLKEDCSIDVSLLEETSQFEFLHLEICGKPLSFIALVNKHDEDYRVTCGSCFMDKDGNAIMYLGKIESKFVTGVDGKLLSDFELRDEVEYRRRKNQWSFIFEGLFK